MRGEKEKHLLDGRYVITAVTGDACRYETEDHQVELRSTADDDHQIVCPDHHGRFRYRHLTWGEETVEGTLVELPDHVNRGQFRIEVPPPETPEGLKKIRCVFGVGVGPTEPGSWTAEETGVGGGRDGRGQGGQGGR